MSIGGKDACINLKFSRTQRLMRFLSTARLAFLRAMMKPSRGDGLADGLASSRKAGCDALKLAPSMTCLKSAAVSSLSESG